MKPNLWLLIFAAVITCAGTAAAQTTSTTALAADQVEAALAQAKRESKNVFLASGFPACSWCKLLDRYHAVPEVKQILEKSYVIVKIDTENTPDGTAVFEKYSKVGAPAWVVISPDGKPLIDSYENNNNVSYPAKLHEIAHYQKALNATSSVTQAEVDLLSRHLQKTASNKQPAAASPSSVPSPQ